MANQMANQPIPQLPALLKSDKIKTRFNEVLGKNSAAFMSALLTVYNGNRQLQECDGLSILGAAGLAATLNLSITPSLGQAYIVPFKGKNNVYQATFQIGVRGLVQLAHRTGKYAALHAGKVCDGEIAGFNPVTGEPEIGEKLSDEVVGYVAYMRLVNGFEKTVYMTEAEIEAHALKYSQSYGYDKRFGKKSSPWSTNFDAMASKTVLKRLLNAWGILSADMAEALQADQSVVDKQTVTYVDNGGNTQARGEIFVSEIDEPEPDLTVDAETGEVISVGGMSNAQD
ncbi:MAG: recombinase RecT [Selenomonadaceae bacterium]|nr:recombinase RecT [Selenomonadaceae bacterium]